jgi:hypothetical protein
LSLEVEAVAVVVTQVQEVAEVELEACCIME